MIKVFVHKKDEIVATEQEMIIVQCLADDMRPTDIGPKVFRSPRTVENIIAGMKAKLDVKTNAAMVYIFCKNGLIQ